MRRALIFRRQGLPLRPHLQRLPAIRARVPVLTRSYSQPAPPPVPDPPSTRSESQSDVQGGLSRLVSLARPDAPVLAGAGAALLASSGITLGIPMFMGQIIDVALDATATRDPRQWAGGLMLLLGVQSVLVVMREGLLTLTGERVIYRLRRRLFSALMAQELHVVEGAQAGDTVSRLQADAAFVKSAVTSSATTGLRAVIMGVGGTCMLCYLSPTLAAVSLALIPPVAVGGRYFGRSMKERQRVVQDRVAEANAVAEWAVASLRSVRALGGEPTEERRYADRLGVAFRAAIGVAGQQAVFDGLMSLAANATIVAVLWVGAQQVISGAMTPGGLMSFLLYSVNVGFSFANLSTVYTDVMKAAGATTRVFEIIDSGAAPTATTTAGPEPRALAPVPGTAYQRAVERFVAPPPPPESLLPPALLCTAADAGSGSHPCPRAGVAIVFDAVSFTYPSRASPVLSALSLTLRGGEHVALVGGSGSGKTTLAGLLLRLYDPSAGGVYLWGRALSDIDTGELRRRVTTVPQELSLFSGTIAENIRYGRGDASDAEVRAAAQDAGVTAFTASMPEQLDTQVGDRGMQLSGGQRQRIAVARALLRRPDVLILDEATSALDLGGEAAVNSAVKALQRQGTTVISIAHRPSTIQAADQVIVLENGAVAQQGRFDELMGIKGGALQRLLQENASF